MFFFLFLGLLTRVYWVLLSFLDFNLGSLGFTRSSRVSFGILQGLTRLKKVWNLFCFLLDFTGFYLVLLDFTGFCSCFYPFWFVCIVLVGFIMSFTGFYWCLKFDLLGFAVFFWWVRVSSGILQGVSKWNRFYMGFSVCWLLEGLRPKKKRKVPQKLQKKNISKFKEKWKKTTAGRLRYLSLSFFFSASLIEKNETLK